MIVVMKATATEAEIQAVIGMVEKLDYSAHVIRGVERTVVACVGEERGEQGLQTPIQHCVQRAHASILTAGSKERDGGWPVPREARSRGLLCRP